jgi:hypothetical protein
MYQTEIKQQQIDRIEMYFSDHNLRAIITSGASKKCASKVTDREVHSAFEESSWSYHLLRHITHKNKNITTKQQNDLLDSYIAAIKQLTTSQNFFCNHDTRGNKRYPLWIRLIDGLNQQSTNHKIAPKLSSEQKEKINNLYNAFKVEVDKRKKKRAIVSTEFNQIFSEKKYKEVREAIKMPCSNEIIPKHCGKLLLEIPNKARKARCITHFFEALSAHANVPLATKLVNYYVKSTEEYSRNHTNALSKKVLDLGAIGIQRFTATKERLVVPKPVFSLISFF